MRVSLDLTADALVRLTADAARRNVGLGAVIDELAVSLPELAVSLPMPAESFGLD